MARPTSEELENLSLAAQKLWTLDSNRLTPGRDYEINVQSGKSVGGQNDVAGQPLFTRVDESVWERPTYKAFTTLLDNYISSTGESDVLSPDENQEVQRFLDTVLPTAPMQYAFSYLVSKNKSERDVGSFKRQLQDIWFEPYNRDGQLDSSGFEHVFAGEFDISKGEVSGLHNWIRFYQEEQAGNIDYKGYIFPRRRGSSEVDAQDQMLTVQFAWKGELKKLSSMFIGSSPEFEFALFSLCFLLGKEVNNVEIDRYDVIIKCFRIRTRNGEKVGTAYPELLQEDDSNVGAAASVLLEQQTASGGFGGGSNAGAFRRQQGDDQGERRRPDQGAGQGNQNAWGRRNEDEGNDDEQRRPGQGYGGRTDGGNDGGNAWGRQGRNNDDDDGDERQRPGQGYGRGNVQDDDGGNTWGRQGRNDNDDDGDERQRPGQGYGRANVQDDDGGNAWGRQGRNDNDDDGDERRRPGQGYGRGNVQDDDGGNAWGRQGRNDGDDDDDGRRHAQGYRRNDGDDSNEGTAWGRQRRNDDDDNNDGDRRRPGQGYGSGYRAGNEDDRNDDNRRQNAWGR